MWYTREVYSVQMDTKRRNGHRFNGVLAALMRRRNVRTVAYLAVHNMNAVEKRSLRKLCGISLADRICNE